VTEPQKVIAISKTRRQKRPPTATAVWLQKHPACNSLIPNPSS